MECPHCDYLNGLDTDTWEDVKGEDGDFWVLPVNMQRRDPYDRFNNVHAHLYACPHCKKTFIG